MERIEQTDVAKVETTSSKTLDVEEVYERDRSTKVVMSGGMFEGFAGTAAVVLAIVGLSLLVYAESLAAVATLVIGVAFLFNAGTLGARFSHLLCEIQKGSLRALELRGGLTGEIIGGVIGVILGILALLGVVPGVMIVIASMVFGGTLILSSGALATLNWLPVTDEKSSEAEGYIAWAVRAAAWMQLLLGASAFVLGLIALTGTNTVVLGLVALLVAGFSMLISGTALCERMFNYEPRLAYKNL